MIENMGKRYTVEDFLDKKIFIDAPAGKDRDDLFKLLAEKGVTWNGGRKLIPGDRSGTEYDPEHTVLAYRYLSPLTGSKGISHGSAEFHEIYDPHIPIVPVAEIMKNENEFTVTMWRDGDSVQGILTMKGNFVKSAKATCHPKNKFSVEVGCKLVLERLVEPEPVITCLSVGQEQRLRHWVGLGFNWLVKHESGRAFVFKNKPVKLVATWASAMGFSAPVSGGSEADLVSWDDAEPVDIELALKNLYVKKFPVTA